MNEFRTSDGLRLDYRDEGVGTAVLCLPGLTRDLSDFDDFAAAVTDVRLIRLTLRGRKGSDFDPVYGNYNVVQESRDVVEFMDFLGLEKTLIVGTSRGGMIAAVLAATVADRVSGVLLNDIGPELDPSGLNRISDYLGVAPKAENLSDLITALKSNMAAGFPDLTDERWAKLAHRWFDIGAEIGLTYDPMMREAMLEQPETPDLWPLFDMMAGIPLALVRGENSDLLSRETVKKMQSRRADLIYGEVPNRGHVPFLDEPESLAVFQQLLKAVS